MTLCQSAGTTDARLGAYLPWARALGIEKTVVFAVFYTPYVERAPGWGGLSHRIRAG